MLARCFAESKTYPDDATLLEEGFIFLSADAIKRFFLLYKNLCEAQSPTKPGA